MCTTIVEFWKQAVITDSSKPKANAEEVRAVLEKMKSALDEFDTLLIDDVLEQLGDMRFDEKQTALFDRLQNAAEDSDIDLCCSIVDEWTKLLTK